MDINTDKIAREILEVVPTVMGTIRVEMRSRRRADLSVVQFRALVYLDMNPGASLSPLAEHLGLTLPTVSQMIDGLVEKGVVNRSESSTDRRCVMLSLTGQGKSLLETSFAGTQARLSEIISSLGKDNLEVIHHALLLLDELFRQPQPAKSIIGNEQPYP